MKNISFFLLVSAVILAVMSGCVTYPDFGRVEVGNENVRVAVAFSDADRSVIHHYYRSTYKYLPPGLAKKKKLPKGLRKQLAKNGHLPPGLEKRRLPSDLERELSPLPRGYVRVQIGGDVVLLNESTQVIADIVYDVWD